MSVDPRSPGEVVVLPRCPRSTRIRRWLAVLSVLLVTSACAVSVSDREQVTAVPAVAEVLQESPSPASPTTTPQEIEEESAPVDPDVAASEEESAPVDPDVAASEEPADDADDDLAADAEAAESPEPVPTLGTALDPAPIGFEALSSAAEHGVARPVRLTIESIDVAAAPVIPVGIDAADESMEIPPADEVGWYRFGAKPGADGSAVLAAHIAYDGRDGVFRRLAELDEGSVVVIEFDDGSSQRWLVEQVTDYDKTELPDELFAVDGDPTLALITCGGLFNPSLRSYESNTVAVARPL